MAAPLKKGTIITDDELDFLLGNFPRSRAAPRATGVADAGAGAGVGASSGGNREGTELERLLQGLGPEERKAVLELDEEFAKLTPPRPRNLVVDIAVCLVVVLFMGRMILLWMHSPVAKAPGAALHTGMDSTTGAGQDEI